MNPIVVVDDEPAIRSSLAAVLEDEGYPVRCCAHARELYDILKAVSYTHLTLPTILRV